MIEQLSAEPIQQKQGLRENHSTSARVKNEVHTALAVAALTTIDPAGARHSSSELGSALAVAALQCCSSKIGCMKVKN